MDYEKKYKEALERARLSRLQLRTSARRPPKSNRSSPN